MIPIKKDNLELLAQLHFKAIEQYINSELSSSTQEFNNTIQQFLPNETIESLVKARPEKLRNIAKSIGQADQALFKGFIQVFNKLSTSKQLYVADIHGNNSPYNFSTILNALQVDVCPYTNRHYVSTSDQLPSFDLFYSINKYPYLCLSFFNLIPCSKESIETRNGKDVGVNPYDNSFPFHKIYLRFKILNSDWAFNAESLEIEWDLSRLENADKAAFQLNIDAFQLKEQYQLHKGIVQTEVHRAFLLPPSYLDSLLQSYGNKVFPSKMDMNSEERQFLHVFDNYLHIPLSKLISDIHEQLTE